MAEIVNIRQLRRKLNELVAKSHQRHDGSVIVGYAAGYALWVHENLEARHAPGKQAKYLEQPARELANSGVFRQILGDNVARVGLRRALLMCGLRLQRESQRIVPVDTGNLRGSAYTAEG